MAIFEKKFERKITLDDTQSLGCVIETAQEVDGHTVSASIEGFLLSKNAIASNFVKCFRGSLGSNWIPLLCCEVWPFKFFTLGGA